MPGVVEAYYKRCHGILGDKNEIFRTENKAVTNFVYSSNLYKKIRKMYLKK